MRDDYDVSALREVGALILAFLAAQSAIAQPASTPTARHISIEGKVSVGAARVNMDALKRGGFDAVMARAATQTLIEWMAAEGTLSDDAVIEATIGLSVMLEAGVLTRQGMDMLCAVAPKCVSLLAAGGGLTVAEANRHIDNQVWVASNALPKMFAVAGNRFYGRTGRDAYEIVRSAEALPPLRR